MTLIDKIKIEVLYTPEVRKIAEENNISYNVAKIMYNDGKMDIPKEDAIKINEIISKYKLPINIAKNLIWYNDINEVTIGKAYYEIGKDYNNENIDKLDIKYYFNKHAYKLIKKGFTFEDVLKLDKIMINIIMKVRNVSEFVATSLYYYGKDSKKYAETLEKAYQFSEKNPDKPVLNRPNDQIRNYFLNSNDFKRKKLYGINIVSETEEGLNALVDLVEQAYDNGKEESLIYLSSLAEIDNLILTDIEIDSSKSSAYYDKYYKLIYINPKILEKEYITENIETFYHEATHFLDHASKDHKETYSEEQGEHFLDKIQQYITKFDENSILNSKYVPRIIKDMFHDMKLTKRGIQVDYFTKIESKKYVNDAAMRAKWEKEIKEKNPNISETEFKCLYQQKINYERKKYISLSRRITDIYDAISDGKLSSIWDTSGHGRKYYSKEENKVKEFFAQIGAIYTSKGEDILEYEFGEELGSEIISTYEEFIKEGISKPKYAYSTTYYKDYLAYLNHLKREFIKNREVQKRITR